MGQENTCIQDRQGSFKYTPLLSSAKPKDSSAHPDHLS